MVRPLLPMRAESLPPMRTLNGEKYVADPPPEGAQVRRRQRVLERPRRGDGRDRVGAGVAGHSHPAMTTTSPTARPCATLVLIVAVDPDEVAPGTTCRALPPPRRGDRSPCACTGR